MSWKARRRAQDVILGLVLVLAIVLIGGVLLFFTHSWLAVGIATVILSIFFSIFMFLIVNEDSAW